MPVENNYNQHIGACDMGTKMLECSYQNDLGKNHYNYNIRFERQLNNTKAPIIALQRWVPPWASKGWPMMPPNPTAQRGIYESSSVCGPRGLSDKINYWRFLYTVCIVHIKNTLLCICVYLYLTYFNYNVETNANMYHTWRLWAHLVLVRSQRAPDRLVRLGTTWLLRSRESRALGDCHGDSGGGLVAAPGSQHCCFPGGRGYGARDHLRSLQALQTPGDSGPGRQHKLWRDRS